VAFLLCPYVMTTQPSTTDTLQWTKYAKASLYIPVMFPRSWH